MVRLFPGQTFDMLIAYWEGASGGSPTTRGRGGDRAERPADVQAAPGAGGMREEHAALLRNCRTCPR